MSNHASRLEPVAPEEFKAKYGAFHGQRIEEKWTGVEELRLVGTGAAVTPFLSLAPGLIVCDEKALEDKSIDTEVDEDGGGPAWRNVQPRPHDEDVEDEDEDYDVEEYEGVILARLLYAGAEYLEAVEVESGTKLSVFNYTMISNCVDRKNTIFEGKPGESPVTGVDQGYGIRTVAVYPHLVGGATIFRFPQDRSVLAACTDPMRGDEFYRTVTGSQWSKYFSFTQWGKGYSG